MPELEHKVDLAKKQLFVLFDFATLSPHELRLNSSTFSWSANIFEVLHESKQMIEAKTKQFQELLLYRIERLVEDIESVAEQVMENYRAAKRYATASGSSTGVYRSCSHLANASGASSATASLPFRPRLTGMGFPISVL